MLNIILENDMTKKSFIALTLAVLISAGSYAVANNTYPEKGLWWDLQASGRGYFINRHEDSMFITTFHYGVDGEAEWLSSLEQYVVSEEAGIMGVCEGPVFHNSDGQCIACDYVEPISSESVQGPMTITFSDYRNAVFEWRM